MSAAPAIDPPEGEVSAKDIWKLAWKVAVIAFLVLAFGGLALREYAILRFNDATYRPEALFDGGDWWHGWLRTLVVFAVCGAVTFTSLVVAWRLIHSKSSAPSWGLGVLVLAILVFTVLVWPTAWAYREYGCEIMRVNRLTGTKTTIGKLPRCEDTAPRQSG